MKKEKSKHGWIRERDCYYAEKIGYKWFPLNKTMTDFDGRTFTHVLSKLGYLTGILEPDTRVPNFSTNAHDALNLADALGVDMQEYLQRILADVDKKLTEHGANLNDLMKAIIEEGRVIHPKKPANAHRIEKMIYFSDKRDMEMKIKDESSKIPEANMSWCLMPEYDLINPHLGKDGGFKAYFSAWFWEK